MGSIASAHTMQVCRAINLARGVTSRHPEMPLNGCTLTKGIVRV
jgi:hypothetical protein